MVAAIFVFLLVSGAVVGAYFAMTNLPAALERRRLDQRLRDLAKPADHESTAAAESDSIVARPKEGPLPAIDRLVSKSNGGIWLGKLIDQSGVKTTPSAIVIISVALAAGVWLLASLFVHVPVLPLLAAVIAGALPVLFLMNRRHARTRVFEERFPEALDLLSRALRAGHAFQTAMGMVADELEDPVGPEFKKTFDQQNFGLPLKEALTQLSERVPLLDVRFFVTAVVIQRETGGNLSEILDNLAYVVRERFKVQRQIRVHTAHGRFTAFVLLSLPPVLAGILTMVNPDHMDPLFHERMGQMMLVAATIMQGIGFVWIRKVIKIEV
jgi:tight adherence protein B